jgi:HK97 family phage major capsid protein
MPELKELQDQLMTTFTELKAMGQRQEDEIKKFGEATGETKATIGKINTAMDEIKGRIDAMETKFNRTGFNPDGSKRDEQAEAKSEAFYNFVKHGIGALSKEEKALVQDATGEIIVPEDLDNIIYRALPGNTVMRSLASVRKTNSNRVRRISMTEATTGWGKLETTAAVLTDFESTPTPSEAYINVWDALGLVKIGEDELEDTNLNLQAFLGDSFSNAYASLEDTAFMVGTGDAGSRPTGILNGATVTRFDTATVNAFVVDDLIKLAYAVPAGYRKNGSYIVHSLIEQTVRLAKDSQGQYLWQPSLQAGTPNIFNGRPIHTQDDLSGTIATGNNVAVFGDIKAGYQIVDRVGSTITRINELYLNDGLVGFKYKRRVGGGVVRANAMRILKIK